MSSQRFQLRHSAVEDRIIVSIEGAETGRTEFALTRRLLRRLWPGLSELVREAHGLVPDPPEAPPIAPPAGAATLPRMPGGDAVATGSTPRTPTGAPAAPSAGEATAAAPARHLVRRVRIVSKGPDTKVMILSDGVTALNVPLSPRQLLDLVDALRAIVERAEWEIDTVFDWELADEAAGAAGTIDITADSPSRFRH